MREVVIDTETTGLDPRAGHRIVEIACLELSHHLRTGRSFHSYLNPEREIPEDAIAIHGLDAAFLSRQPLFAQIADALLLFIGTDPLVIHNAEFDLAFLNAELERLGRKPLGSAHIDTLALARRRFPGAPASLDALCRRFQIDLSRRDRHGAEIDCELLATVYVELLGGKQPGLDLTPVRGLVRPSMVAARASRPHAPSPEELARHEAMLEGIRDPIWRAED